ncbi:MAG: hypothetical protein ACK5AZ_10650 [Bryobacteraceae bacterium]
MAGIRGRTLFGVVVVGLAAGAIAAAVVQYRAARESRAVVAELEAAARQAREEAERWRLESEELRLRLGEPDEPEASRVEAPARRDNTAELAARVDQVRLLSQMKDDLAKANESIAEMQLRVQELESEIANLTAENRRLAVAEAETQESLASSRRVVEAMQVELKGKSDRLVQLEINNRRHAEQIKTANEKINRLTASSRELEDLNRQREVYLTNILRRYRDLSDQLRALAVRVDTPQESPAPQRIDLSRIQNTLLMTEEDLKQLSSLNARALGIHRKMRE